MTRPFPAGLAWFGVPAIVVVWLQAVLIVLERTVWAWERGAEVVVSSPVHSGVRVLLAAGVFLLALLWPIVVLLVAAVRRNNGGKKVITMLVVYAVGGALALTPYSFWQRVFAGKFTSLHAVELMSDAAGRGDLRTVRAFLDIGTPVNSRVALDTALHVAAWHSKLDVMRYLVSRGADVNAPGRGGSTALHLAAFHANLEVMQYLISCGADVNAINALGDSPMAKARQAQMQWSEEAQALLAKHGGRFVEGTAEQRFRAFERMREDAKRMETDMPK
jgi:Ankyrin repeats (3 copies)